MLLTQLLSASPLAVPAWAQQQQLQLQKQQQQGELHHQAREQQEYRRLVTQNKDLRNEDRQEVFIVRQEEHHTRHHQLVNTFEVPVVPSDTSNLRNLPIVTNWLEKPPDFQKVAIQLKASSNNFGIENRDRNPSSLGLPPNQEPNFTIHHQKVTKKDYYEKRNVTNLFRKNLKTVSSFSNPSLSFPASSLVKSNPPDIQTPTLQTPTTLSNPNNGTSAKINDESSARVKNGSVFVENEAKSSISSISSAKPINLQSESDPRKVTTDISPVRQIWNSYGYLVTVVTIGVIVILAFFGVVRCLRATSRASRALAHPIPLLQEDRTPLNAEPAHPVPMLSVQSPGCAGMERLGVPARTLSSSPVARHDNDRNHHHHLNNRIMRVDHRDLLGNSSSSSSSTSCLKQQGLEQESSSSSAATGDYNCHQRSIRLGSSDVQQQYPGGVRCPHHVKLPDSEWGNDRDLQARAPYQAEITRSYIKPPPNKTAPNVPDSSTYISSHPSKYSSSNLSIFPNPPHQQQHQASSYLSSTTTSTTTSASLTCIGPYQASASTSKASKQYNPFTRLFKIGGSGSGSGGGGNGGTSHHSSKPLRPDSPSRHYQNGGKLDKSSSASSSRHKIPTNSIPISLSSVSLASYCSSTTYAEHSGALSTRSATNLADPGSMQLINSSSSVHSSNLCVYVACNSVPSNGSGHQMAPPPPTYPKLGCDTDDRRLCCSGSGGNGVGVNYNNSNMLDNNNSMSEIHNSINNRIIMESNDTLRCDRRNFVEKRIKTEEGAEEAPSLDAAGGPSAQCEMTEPSPNSRYRNQHNASSPHI